VKTILRKGKGGKGEEGVTLFRSKPLKTVQLAEGGKKERGG